MKRVDFKKHSSVFYVGRGLLIASVVTTVSLGFLLGFFVARQMYGRPAPPSASQPLDAAQQTAQRGPSHEVVQEQSGTPQSTLQDSPQRTDDRHTPDQEQVRPSPKPPAVAKPPGVTLPPAERAQPKGAVAHPEQQVQAFRPPAESAGSEKSRHAQEKQALSKTAPAGKYTVQIGAFKKQEEAEALRNTMSKKGYKVSVFASRTKKQETLYKVTVGEYATRREAEILSVKLRSTEGLPSFVTFVAQEGTTRYQ